MSTEATREKLRLAIETDKAKGKLRPSLKGPRCCGSCGRETTAKYAVCVLCLYGEGDNRYKKLTKEVEGDDV
jgi:hypothetical protein